MTTAVIGLILGTGLGLFCFQLMRLRQQSSGGFQDWVRNPAYKSAAADYLAAREALTVPEDITDEEVGRMVDRLFIQIDDDFNFDRLKLVGRKAVPHLVKALQRPETRTSQFDNSGHVFAAASPFERICRLLEEQSPYEAVEPLSTYVDHDDTDFRASAAMLLGSIASAKCIEPIRRALNDSDDSVPTSGMIGIRRGIENGTASQKFLDAVFEELLKQLRQSEDLEREYPAALMLEIDAERASLVLLSGDFFTLTNPRIDDLIRAFNQKRLKIPHDNLFPLMHSLRIVTGDSHRMTTYAETLKAYALNPDDSAEDLIRAELNSPEKLIQHSAADALAILFSVDRAWELAIAAESQGFDSLSKVRQYYVAAQLYDAEVNNGGHSQYFVNSAGGYWKTAIEGLQVIGATDRAAILEEAATFFGKSGPSDNNSARHRQLSKLSRRQMEMLDRLDDRYYILDEDLHVMMIEFTIRHLDEFMT